MTDTMARIAGFSDADTSFDDAVQKPLTAVPVASFPSNSEYHRRRAEIELDRALTARTWANAVRHLELARLHRARRARSDGRSSIPKRPLLCAKEG